MKALFFILSLLALGWTSNSLAARKAPKVVEQLQKEQTGRCFYYESVYRTRLGWMSHQEIQNRSPRIRKMLRVASNSPDFRKVYVPKNWCSQGRS